MHILKQQIKSDIDINDQLRHITNKTWEQVFTIISDFQNKHIREIIPNLSTDNPSIPNIYFNPHALVDAIVNILTKLITEQIRDDELRQYLLEKIRDMNSLLVSQDPNGINPPAIYSYVKYGEDGDATLCQEAPSYAAYTMDILDKHFPGIMEKLLKAAKAGNYNDVLYDMRQTIGDALYESLRQLDYSKGDFEEALKIIQILLSKNTDLEQQPNQGFINPIAQAVALLASYGLENPCQKVVFRKIFPDDWRRDQGEPRVLGQYVKYAGKEEDCIYVRNTLLEKGADLHLLRVILHEEFHAIKPEFLKPIFEEGLVEYWSIHATVPELIKRLWIMLIELDHGKTDRLPHITHEMWSQILDQIQNVPNNNFQLRRADSSSNDRFPNLREKANMVKERVLAQFDDPELKQYLSKIGRITIFIMFHENRIYLNNPVPPLIYWEFNSDNHSLMRPTISVPAYAAYALEMLNDQFPGILYYLLTRIRKGDFSAEEILEEIKKRIGQDLYDSLATLPYTAEGFSKAIELTRNAQSENNELLDQADFRADLRDELETLYKEFFMYISFKDTVYFRDWDFQEAFQIILDELDENSEKPDSSRIPILFKKGIDAYMDIHAKVPDVIMEYLSILIQIDQERPDKLINITDDNREKILRIIQNIRDGNSKLIISSSSDNKEFPNLKEMAKIVKE
ncbi:MAG: hypothetical protein KatS3mg083_314 [Candidatus Dojkabacteria bacterium]|nr:MAG: hypothetical protein KatS3mg083_314 [Candidatus Dojkabacteria bacterium]